MSFVQLVEADGSIKTPEVESFLNNVKDAFKKKFPNGYFASGASVSFGHGSATIRLGLIEKESDCANGIRQNDPMFHILSIHSKDDTLSRTDLTCESLTSGIMTNPEPGSYMAMSRVKTKPRKLTGDLIKIEKGIIKWFDTLRKAFDENKTNIYGVERYDAKYLK